MSARHCGQCSLVCPGIHHPLLSAVRHERRAGLRTYGNFHWRWADGGWVGAVRWVTALAGAASTAAAAVGAATTAVLFLAEDQCPCQRISAHVVALRNAGTAFGGLLGGCVGDAAAKHWPLHGRIAVTQASWAGAAALLALPSACLYQHEALGHWAEKSAPSFLASPLHCSSASSSASPLPAWCSRWGPAADVQSDGASCTVLPLLTAIG